MSIKQEVEAMRQKMTSVAYVHTPCQQVHFWNLRTLQGCPLKANMGTGYHRNPSNNSDSHNFGQAFLFVCLLPYESILC